MSSIRVQHQAGLKSNNCRIVLRLLRDNRHKMISRADLAKETEMSPTSITRLIRQLLDLDLVCQNEAFSKGTGVGRNGIQVSINPDAFYSMGLSIDSDYVKVCIINCVDEVLAETEEALEERYYDPAELLKKAKDMLDHLILRYHIRRDKVQALGVACVGNVDHVRGYSHFASQMGWHDVDLALLVYQVFGMDACIDNDVKMALIGATYQFAHMRNSDSVYVSIGAGVGASIMYDGKMVRGRNNAVGEVGHTHFADEGRQCVCGRKDCAYTYISTPALLEMCKKCGHPMDNLEALAKAIDAGEGWTRPIIDQYTKYLSIFIADMVYIYNPEYLLVGGELITSHPVFFEQMQSKVQESIIHDNLASKVVIKKRELKNNAALGAACAANEQHVLQIIESYE
ncbi:MAG: ROK family transcriptional regulator [Lachnospiraceae bacterium]|uniref:ROK family transcriptional regulator n=1 Tax=Parablautia sp. Marseille-Q6255 TaxID=3039593 RepID=UPI0024BC3927|nr:ROK family transcriptional regulator [Parablautia sp. Marseille-Q6255]